MGIVWLERNQVSLQKRLKG